ncbi:hypothetical protein BVY03_02845 [bacterium K02(2017)]|nr:hypothetical protein BVY03_02845 [bacterium K02(2017)]
MLISIIIPTLNRAGKVLRAIDSVLNQSYKKIELIVIDDGSTDDTAYWLTKIKDPRFKFYTKENQGVAASRNFGVSKASADWICFLDSDDVWHRHKLSLQLKYHQQHENILVSQTDDIWIRNSVKVNKMQKHQTREGQIFEQSLKLCLICSSSIMLKKQLFLKVGGFDESMPCCEDYDLALRLTAKYELGLIHKKLVSKFGGHTDQLSKKYPMMDKYRVFALKKLLGANELNPKQIELTQQELNIKNKIIANGAKKRNHETSTKP